jgi:flagellar hook-basal body complex protein FliE
MASPIAAISAFPALAAVPHVAPAIKPETAFKAVFDQAIANVEVLRTDADLKIDRFLKGEGGDLHEVALATQRAELSFEMFQQVRNKVVQAYQEIMRMQM